MPTISDLKFLWGYYNDDALRPALNTFAVQMFPGLDFSAWNALGCDMSAYTPFSFFHHGRVVANVSASPMVLVVEGRRRPAIQIGTVAVLPEYRGHGLVRELIERVHCHWQPTHDLFFLFTHPDASDMYQRFGYRRVQETVFSMPFEPSGLVPRGARRLDLRSAADLALFGDLTERREPISFRLGSVEQSWLLLFHASSVYPQQLFYIEEFDTVVIRTGEGADLDLIDVISEKTPTLEQLLPYSCTPQTKLLRFRFTPDRFVEPGSFSAPDTQSWLYVRGEFCLENQCFTFPETSRA